MTLCDLPRTLLGINLIEYLVMDRGVSKLTRNILEEVLYRVRKLELEDRRMNSEEILGNK